jgi:folylpolyglutamate synthase/dihydropteroate synthase
VSRPLPGPKITIFSGGTDRLAGAHIRVETSLPLPPPDWPRLLQASVEAASKLASRHAELEFLAAAAALIATASGEDPLSRWIDAFRRLFQIPPRQQRAESGEGGEIAIDIGCPYPQPGAQLVRLALDLLSPGSGPSVATLRQRFLAIGSALPPPPTMAWHAALDARQIPWSWRGGADTIVGYGSRQKRLLQPRQNPDRVARQLKPPEYLIPIYTVAGSVGKTTSARLLALLLENSGLRVGLTASDGGWAAGRQVMTGDCIGATAAKDMLQRADIDVAVLELGRGGIMNQGLVYPSSDVAVLLNVLSNHVGKEGIDTLDQLADLKARTVERARIAILNADDDQCRRISQDRASESLVWFSLGASAGRLAELSRDSRAALGVRRTPEGRAQAISIWRNGQEEVSLSLEGVAPFHGSLGEKTVEELLAVTAAASCGPVRLPDLEPTLRKLRLDGSNHAFRSSLHGGGENWFVLDKAHYAPEIELLGPRLSEICEVKAIAHRICVFTLAVRGSREGHLPVLRALYPLADEFIYYDRPHAYDDAALSPEGRPESILPFIKEEVERLNAESGRAKPIELAGDWAAAETSIIRRLEAAPKPALVLILQPMTKEPDLSRSVLAFVGAQARALGIEAAPTRQAGSLAAGSTPRRI